MNNAVFADALTATGHRRIALAGVTNGVGTVYPALTLVTLDYEAQVGEDVGNLPCNLADVWSCTPWRRLACL